MLSNSPKNDQLSILEYPLETQLNPRNPLFLLSNKIPWDYFKKSFKDLYKDSGRPAKPIRLMVGLLLLKRIYNESDESVVEKWVENPYWQYFCGEEYFQWKFPIDPSDLVYFRKRIGKDGAEKILKVSIELHGKKACEKEIIIDTTVQEKNITYPTDTKLCKKIIDKCVKIAKTEEIPLRQSYKRVSKKYIMDQRWRNNPKKKKQALSSARKLKTIAGRLIRELRRKIPKIILGYYENQLRLFEKVLKQKIHDSNKIYSLHESQVYCISKGKEHKKYEYGSKVSIAYTKKSGIIVGALNFERNIYDGKTLPETLDQHEKLIGIRAEKAIVDRGCRGRSIINGTEILVPNRSKKNATVYERRKARLRFRRRAAIEPVIGHLKFEYRLCRNYLKGVIGDDINVILSSAGFNFKKYMRFIFVFMKYLIRNWVLELNYQI